MILGKPSKSVLKFAMRRLVVNWAVVFLWMEDFLEKKIK